MHVSGQGGIAALPAIVPGALPGPDESLLRQIVGRDDIVRLFEIEHFDLIGIDELLQDECPFALHLDRVDLLLLQQDILTFLVFVAFDDVLGIDRT